MRFLSMCWAVSVLLVGPAALYAGNCRAVIAAPIRHNAVVVEKNIIREDVIVRNVVKLLEIPLYSIGYQPTAAYPAPVVGAAAIQQPALAPALAAQPCQDVMRQMTTLLQGIDNRLRQLEGKAGLTAPPPMPLADQPAAKGQDPAAPAAAPGGDGELVALAVENCASCHSREKAQASGKGFVILDGGRFAASLTPQALGDIIDRLSETNPKRAMPPQDAPPMSAEKKLRMISKLVGSK